jgi:Mor family transcriptional regulator
MPFANLPADPEVKSLLPSSLRFLAEQGVSVRSILALIGRFGGETLKVPSKDAENSELGRVIGGEDARKVIKFWGGASVYLPRATSLHNFIRDREIRRMRREGATNVAIARHFYITERTVRAILARTASTATAPNADPSQGA